MADSFDFSQPAIDLHVKPSAVEMGTHNCCADRLLDDIKDARFAAMSGHMARAQESESGSITPFFGVLTETTPGQPLAFDSNFRKLDFGPSPGAAESKFGQPPIGNNNLQFDRKFSGALIFGLHMKL